jgi:hypothetical protein
VDGQQDRDVASSLHERVNRSHRAVGVKVLVETFPHASLQDEIHRIVHRERKDQHREEPNTGECSADRHLNGKRDSKTTED